jgi:endonuclease/exonuclease/phosphatase family metal-dependent hydrolase
MRVLKGLSAVVLSLGLALAILSPAGAQARDSRCAALLQAPESEVKDLRLMTYNALNLKLGKKGKSKIALQEQGDIILAKSPDVLVLQEVASGADLEQFNATYLHGQYQVFFQIGNDSRGFNIGMLVKSSIVQDFDLEYRSHKDLTYQTSPRGPPESVFSRDLPALIGRHKASGQVAFAVLGMHAKSKRPGPGDPLSVKLRTRQMEATQQIVSNLQAEFGLELPIFLMGDFNTDLHSSQETQALFNIMTDTFDLLARPPPAEDRITHSFHPHGQSAIYAQIDGILVTNSALTLVQDVQVVRYTNKDGTVRPLAKTYKEREKQASDHFAIFAVGRIRLSLSKGGTLK